MPVNGKPVNNLVYHLSLDPGLSSTLLLDCHFYSLLLCVVSWHCDFCLTCSIVSSKTEKLFV